MKSISQLPGWKIALREAADPERARQFVEQLAQTPAKESLRQASADQARILAALFSGSPASATWLVKHPELLAGLAPERLQHPRREEGLRREVKAWLEPALQAREFERTLEQIREFKQREMVRIAARDLAGLGDVQQITAEISAVADVCLDCVWRVCSRQLTERWGQPYHLDMDEQWQRTAFAVIGLGKLGGQELNYSSDVDVMFVYSEEGSVFKEPPRPTAAPRPVMNNHQFFKRLAETCIAEVTRATVAGSLFRMDLRLRPEGDAGPLVRSLGSYENFYAQWGQTWERMMLIKARGVAGDAGLAAEFIETVQPFRYPRSLSSTFLREIAAMKDRLETEVVKAGEIDRNIKLGHGGIREVEFVAQTLQVLHAGRIPFLQHAQTLPVLEKLVDYDLLVRGDARALGEAYCFLRAVEHRLQMEHYLQTHTIPADAKPRTRLARLMGFERLQAFNTALQGHTSKVRKVYGKLLKPNSADAREELPRDLQSRAPEWKQRLAEHRFREVDKAFRLLHEFASGPGFVHVSARTVELAWQLIPRLLALCPQPPGVKPGQQLSPADPKSARVASATDVPAPNPGARVLSDPDRVLTRLDSFITAYGTRAMLFETWASNPALFELLLLLFDRSEFLAESAIRTPDLVDELVLSGRMRRRKSAAEILEELRHGLNDPDQKLWLRRYHQAEFMRIGLRDILGLAEGEQNLAELSALADACLQYALEVSLRKQKIKGAPLVIIGLGKLGGQELTYGSDLDLLFVADPAAPNLPKLQRVAVEVLELLSAPGELGVVFDTDARLRPDGEKGLLVNTLTAYEEYYRLRAQLWEIQALSRTRPVAGAPELGERFQQIAAALTNFTPANVAAGFPVAQMGPGKNAGRKSARGPKLRAGLAAYTPGWQQQIAKMRLRVEKERTPAGKEILAIKTGAGGLMDAEFIAQTLCLAQGWQEAHTLRALERAQAKGVLPREDAAVLLQNYRELRRIERILRRWSFEGEILLPDDPAPQYRVAVRCGWTSAAELLAAVAQYRQAVRSVYSKVFNV